MVRERDKVVSADHGDSTDTTENLRLRVELSRQRAFSDALLGASLSPMALCTPNGQDAFYFTMVNHAFCRMLRLEYADVKGCPVASVLERAGPDWLEIWRELEPIMQSGESQTVLAPDS